MRHLAEHLVRAGAVNRSRTGLNQSQENQSAKTSRQPNQPQALLDSWTDAESRAQFEREAAEKAIAEAAQRVPPAGTRRREVAQRTKRTKTEPSRLPRTSMVSASLSAEEYEKVRSYADDRRITVSALIRVLLLPVVGLDPNAKLEPKKRAKY